MAQRFTIWVLVAGLIAVAAPACVQILGGERAVEGDERACDDDSDCDDDEGCADEVCREKCVENDDCGAFRTCNLRFCTDEPGTSCYQSTDLLDIDFIVCGGATCATVDADNDDVLGYCTVSCYVDDLCPDGFECIRGTCLIQ